MSKYMVRATLAAAALATGLFAIAPSSPTGTTFNGVVSDSMCGAKHDMGGGPADCTRMCVQNGGSYVLVVGKKVYTLATTDKRALSELDHLAGKHASVRGALSGMTLNVQSVVPAK